MSSQQPDDTPVGSISVEGDSISFGGFIFPGFANFEAARFAVAADFKAAQFVGDLRLEWARFSGVAVFRGAQFSDDAGFGQAQFSSAAKFREARFAGAAQFGKAQFSGAAEFVLARFAGAAGFVAAQFDGDARFREAQFAGAAGFVAAQFDGDAGFEGAQFLGTARFGEAQFTSTAWFFMAEFTKYVTFANAHFRRDANFNAIRVERGFSLANATFKFVPDFIQAHFEEAPRLDHVTIAPTAPEKDDDNAKADSNDVEARFRALRRLAVQGYDHENERKFLKDEISSRRSKKGQWKDAAYWLGYGYEIFSDFGGSIFRPIIWGAVSVLAFAVIYFWIIPGACPSSNYEQFGQALFRSLKNAILLISWESVVDGGKALTCFKSPDKASIWPLLGFGAVQMLQKLWSTVLWFLLLLAVRNKFRIR